MTLLYRDLFDVDIPAVLEMKLRAEDQEECRAASGLEPEAALAFSVLHSEDVKVIVLDGKLVGVSGVVRIPGGGAPWMLATGALFSSSAIRGLFSRASVDARDKMLAKYNSLSNFVSVKNRKAVRWLKWLGASFHETTTIVDPTVEFIRFSFERRSASV